MFNKILFTVLLLLAGSVVLTGAWPGSTPPPAPSSPPAPPAFLPQKVPLDAQVVGAGASTAELLDKAAEKLAAERTLWLKTKIRQVMTDAANTFVAEGFLQRGPHHCARLEMDVHMDGPPATLLIVSDGELVAEVKKIPKTKTASSVKRLVPQSDAASTGDDDAKERSLAGKGCSGPAILLNQFRQRLQNAKLQTGLLHGQPVIQIKGALNADKLPAFVMTTLPIRFGCVYLDANTLWPTQFEWWGADNKHSLRPVLQMEFRDPELNHELSVAECVRLFSYQPEGVAGTVEEQ